MVGSSTSVSEEVQANAGLNDIWVVRMDSEGDMLWNRTFGGSGEESAYAVRVTPDDEIVLLGNTNSEDGPFGDPISENDMVLGHLAANGDPISFHRLGHAFGNQASDLLVLENGDRVVLGTTVVQEQDLTLQVDVLLLKVSESGAVIWESLFGGSGYESSFNLTQYANGDFMVAATTRSDDGDVTNYMGMGDGWLLRVSPTGELLDERTFGGPYDDQISRAHPTSDGGAILTGYYSNTAPGTIGTRVIAVKLDAEGDTEWTRDYGGTNGDYGFHVQVKNDGGYLLFAYAYSDDGDVSGFHGGVDAWLVRIASDGELLWNRCFGGFEYDSAVDIKGTPDGGTILLMAVEPPVPEMTGTGGPLTAWIVKLAPEAVGMAEAGGMPFRVVPDSDGHGATIHARSSGGVLELMNATGQKLRYQPLAGYTAYIDLSGCPPGIYFLALVQDGNRSTLRFSRP